MVDARGNFCRAGNCEPAWTRELGSDLQGGVQATYKYKVSGDWARNLWQEYKLETSVYEDYLYLCKDKLAANKRNLELYQGWKRERDLINTIKERTKRIKENPDLYTPFGRVPEAEDLLAEFGNDADAMRYPVLLVHAPSYACKSEWAVSFFKNLLYVEIGAPCMWPASMKKLDRSVHDGLVLDDVRDLRFLEENQEKLQGKYNRPVESGTFQHTRWRARGDFGLVQAPDGVHHQQRHQELEPFEDERFPEETKERSCFVFHKQAWGKATFRDFATARASKRLRQFCGLELFPQRWSKIRVCLVCVLCQKLGQLRASLGT